MVTLRINNTDPLQVEIAQRIKNRSLAHKLLTDESQDQPILDAHGKIFTGHEEIEKGFEELDKLTKDWYACRCDMFAD